MFKKKNSYRLDQSNINSYIKDNYGSTFKYKSKLIYSIKSLLQESFGGDRDCSLVSIVTIFAFKEDYKKDFQKIYDEVEKIALKYHYSSDVGTFPIYIKSIINDYGNVKSVAKKFKNLGYNWKIIKQNLDKENPIVLSIQNDGRNYYTNHSVVIVGYREYLDSNLKLLMVYDNWSKQVSYIDYNKISYISSINYI